jgi:hypothetical protein
VHIPDPHRAQLGRPDPGDVDDFGHDVVAAGDRGLAGLRQRRPPGGEKLPQCLLRGRHPQAELAAVPGPIERVDRRGHRDPEPAGDLAGVALLEEREVAVDAVGLAPHRQPTPLARTREVPVHLTRGQLPGHHAVVLADLHDRLDQLVQRGRCQPGDVPSPLVFGQRVHKQALLVAD